MLSDEQLRSAYESGFHAPDLPDDVQAWEGAGLRAVEAAVRADQIEKDAGIADDNWGRGEAAPAIRAQLEGTTDE